MRLLLPGSAGYSAMDVVHILKNRMRRAVTGLRVKVNSEWAEGHPLVMQCVLLGVIGVVLMGVSHFALQ